MQWCDRAPGVLGCDEGKGAASVRGPVCAQRLPQLLLFLFLCQDIVAAFCDLDCCGAREGPRSAQNSPLAHQVGIRPNEGKLMAQSSPDGGQGGWWAGGGSQRSPNVNWGGSKGIFLACSRCQSGELPTSFFQPISDYPTPSWPVVRRPGSFVLLTAGTTPPPLSSLLQASGRSQPVRSSLSTGEQTNTRWSGF